MRQHLQASGKGRGAVWSEREIRRLFDENRRFLSRCDSTAMSGPPVKLSFGLNKAQLPRQPVKRAVPGKSAFGLQPDDDDDDSLELPAHLDTAKAKNRPAISTATLTKAKRAQQQAELELDQSVYEYDEVYDNMKAAEKVAVDARKQESADRKVRSRVLLATWSKPADRNRENRRAAKVYQPLARDGRGPQAGPPSRRGQDDCARA